MSLVADYSDSDSGEDIGTNNNNNSSERISNLSKNGLEDDTEVDDKCLGEDRSPLPETVSRNNSSSNFLVTAESDSSDENSDEEPRKRKNQPGMKLDNPFRNFGGATNVSKEDSVFRNPFRDKEEEKIAVLEHHVKMTDNPETALTINGKKICWNYRKRKCYLGTQCPFAHDSDVPLTDEQLKEQKAEGDLHRSVGGNSSSAHHGGGSNAPNTKTHLPGTASVVAGGYDSAAFFSSPHLSGGHKKNNDGDLDLEEQQPYSKSKKRVGLTNSLVPPKKALKLYHKTKDV